MGAGRKPLHEVVPSPPRPPSAASCNWTALSCQGRTCNLTCVLPAIQPLTARYTPLSATSNKHVTILANPARLSLLPYSPAICSHLTCDMLPSLSMPAHPPPPLRRSTSPTPTVQPHNPTVQPNSPPAMLPPTSKQQWQHWTLHSTPALPVPPQSVFTCSANFTLPQYDTIDPRSKTPASILASA